ncbi:MAG: hypothetical protein HKN43_08700 [Rhodothermales bacterium]|nr:hypothetical protein [Rhodothermales bacterium]
MSRGLLFIVAASLIGVGSVIFMGQKSRIAVDSEQGEYGYQVTAREIAKSGSDRAISEVRKDLTAVTKQRNGISVAGGEYDLDIVEHNYGELTLVSNGRSGNAEHSIETGVIYVAPLEAAVVLNASEVSTKTSGSYTISGEDHRAEPASDDDSGTSGGSGGSGGSGYFDGKNFGPEVDYSAVGRRNARNRGFTRPARGIMTGSESHANIVAAEIDAVNVTGDGGAGSIGSTSQKDVYEQIYTQAMSNSSVQFLSEPFAGSYGSKNDPAILSVSGDFEPKDSFTGYGLLIIEDGNFEANKHFKWNGVVMARGSGTSELDVIVDDGAEIRGSLVAYEKESVPVPACPVPFDIDGLNTVPKVEFNARFDVVGAAISAGGAYDVPVTSVVHFNGDHEEPWGNWDKPTDGNVNRDGAYVYEPSDSYGPNTTITVSARSWLKKKGKDGSKDDHWNMYMEQASDEGGQQLQVLRNGDTAPGVAGYLGQTSAVEFLADYLNLDGTMNLADNQTIYLFELGSTNPNSAAFDMQDLVVLVTLTAAESDPIAGCVAGGSAGITGKINFEIGGDGAVLYSPEAIAKLGKKLQVIKDATKVTVVSQKEKTDREASSQSMK